MYFTSFTTGVLETMMLTKSMSLSLMTISIWKRFLLLPHCQRMRPAA